MSDKDVKAAPAGYKWVYCSQFRHYRSGKIIRAEDYGLTAFRFLVRAK